MKCYLQVLAAVSADCRSPRGERGLKFILALAVVVEAVVSLPPRGAWIEICRGS